VAHIHFVVYQDLRALSCKDAFLTVSLQRGFTPSQLQDSEYVLGELQEVPVSLFLQSAEISLSGSPALQPSTYLPQPGGKETNTYNQQKTYGYHKLSVGAICK